jgi:hypothetical protein
MDKAVPNVRRANQDIGRILEDKGDTTILKMVSNNSTFTKQSSVNFIEEDKEYENGEENKSDQKDISANDYSNRDKMSSLGMNIETYNVPRIPLKQLYSKQRRKKQLIEFLKVSSILIAWITLSVFISLPLLLIPNSLSILVKTPYITLWMAVLAHFLIFKKLFPSSAKLSNMFT